MTRLFGLLALVVSAAQGLVIGAAAAQSDALPNDPFWQNAYCINPGIPRSAKLNPTEGFAILLFDVTAEGKTTNIRVTSSGSADPSNTRLASDFGKAARQALRRWEYFAYIKDGVEAPRHDVPIRFDFVEDTGATRPSREKGCMTSKLPEPPSHAGDPTLPLVNIARCWRPNIPARADKEMRTAQASLNFDVDNQGNVVNAQAAENQEDNDYTRAALRALKKWKYHPFLKAGEPITRPNLALTFTFGGADNSEGTSSCHHAPFGSAALAFKTANPASRCTIRFDTDGVPQPSRGCRR